MSAKFFSFNPENVEACLESPLSDRELKAVLEIEDEEDIDRRQLCERLMKKVKDGESLEDIFEDWECTLCTEILFGKRELVELACNEIFHFECLDSFNKTKGQTSKLERSCPVCKKGYLAIDFSLVCSLNDLRREELELVLLKKGEKPLTTSEVERKKEAIKKVKAIFANYDPKAKIRTILEQFLQIEGLPNRDKSRGILLWLKEMQESNLRERTEILSDNIKEISETTSEFSPRELQELIEILYQQFKSKLQGYPKITLDKTLSQNVVFTLEERVPEGKTTPIEITGEDGEFQISSKEIGQYVISSYGDGDEGEDKAEDKDETGVEVNESLTSFMCRFFPNVMSRLQDGDIVRISKEGYRNDGVFLVYCGQIINLGEEEGFHDYGLVPRPVRHFYATDWSDYGFANKYPEFDTEEGQSFSERKRGLINMIAKNLK